MARAGVPLVWSPQSKAVAFVAASTRTMAFWPRRALALESPDHRLRHHACQVRVLAVALHHPPPARVAGNVHHRRKVQVDPVRCRLRRRPSGRVLVRWSGTEAKLRVMVEGEDERAIAAHAKEIVAAAKKDVGQALG